MVNPHKEILKYNQGICPVITTSVNNGDFLRRKERKIITMNKAGPTWKQQKAKGMYLFRFIIQWVVFNSQKGIIH